MGGKGRRRREKNYLAAHGGYSRLPPPPDPSSADALPSKLRKLISITSSLSASSKPSVVTHQTNKKPDARPEKEPENELKSEVTAFEEGANDTLSVVPQNVDNEAILHDSTHEKRKKKRKRKRANDLRFEIAAKDLSATGSKRRERKKKYLEACKKKRKKAKTEDNLDFPGHEKIKFGDIVEAPPKLDAVPKPKALKTIQDASHERLRLQAVEAYRNRKGWVSRPGIHLPPPTTTSPSL